MRRGNHVMLLLLVFNVYELLNWDIMTYWCILVLHIFRCYDYDVLQTSLWFMFIYMDNVIQFIFYEHSIKLYYNTYVNALNSIVCWIRCILGKFESIHLFLGSYSFESIYLEIHVTLLYERLHIIVWFSHDNLSKKSFETLWSSVKAFNDPYNPSYHSGMTKK